MRNNQTNMQNKKSGFTLIELLVAIAIVSLLSSIAIVAANSARTKAQDVSKVSEVKQVKTALAMYGADHNGQMPGNYSNQDGSFNSTPVYIGANRAPAREGSDSYNASMQQLVDGKYLPSIPRSSDGVSFSYLNIGAGTSQGVIFGASLGSARSPATTDSACAVNFVINDSTNFRGPPNVVDAALTCEYHAESCLPNSGDIP